MWGEKKVHLMNFWTNIANQETVSATVNLHTTEIDKKKERKAYLDSVRVRFMYSDEQNDSQWN